MPQVEQYKDQLAKLNQYELHDERYIDIILTHPELFTTSYQRLEGLSLNNQTCVAKLLDNLQQFNQDHSHLYNLRALYDTIVQNINDGHFKAHGIKGGSIITFQGEQKVVPKGVSKIWAEIADSDGHFKWMPDPLYTLKKLETFTKERSGSRKLTMVSIFFGSYRDAQTKAAYANLHQKITSLL
ncbi:hypothetical protein PsalN5692_02263 [Piscirickettsia salmonis]|nr:hypothetical protein [Piscirickettsia salmonis]QGP50791.1 hypothetical protein PsalN5692_02263 [Piscirickettsia salmonis]